ncbi:hypothetical protein [Scleromatobacter humisilvae]|uniref:Uncharacterized protein n=1 Tax=Scleromatobacter humisilvae TaxID=2897159 RepID=A0A9X1YH79_9BURK|nr:hypothetical protein [Scleromatobacter humisilvae]MCK9686048.1 hypothetical protein [Scleromatobacter humisilvae]
MRIKLPFLVALGVCHGGICATPEPKQSPSAPTGAAPMLTKTELTKFIDTYEALIYKRGDPDPCDAKKHTCTINIDLITATASDGKDYCVAAIPPLVTIDDKTHKDKWDIQWNLVPNGFTRPVHFHADHGILVLGSTSASQLKEPKAGAHDFHLKHWNLSASTTFYVPIIIVGDETVDPEVCATGDPKIVNN